MIRTLAARGMSRGLITLAGGLGLIGVGWSVLWGVDSWWNPTAFAAIWTGVSLVFWSAGGGRYPGLARHAMLASLSILVWWWFELVNGRVGNWEYVSSFAYGDAEYAALSSVAFATVIPAVVAAAALTGVRDTVPGATVRKASGRFAASLIAGGLILQAAVFAAPTQLYPLVWVAPFLVFDGAVSLSGGESLTAAMLAGRWREPLAIACAGLLCGALWEFWNFWAMPKWMYHVPLLGFWKVFEMPILGYLGYVPFAWSIIQFVRFADRAAARLGASRQRRLG